MTFIPKKRARIYLFLRKDAVQQLLFSLLFFAIVFCYITFHVQDQLITFYKTPLFYSIIWESTLYTILIGLPVYFSRTLFYKYRVQNQLALKFWSKKFVYAWGFYTFILFSALTIFLANIPISLLLDQWMNLIDPKWYENILVMLLLVLCNVGISYSKDTFEQYRRFDRMRRQQQIEKRRRTEEELMFIKKQIRPHFLFNTLANLQILAKQKSDILPDLMGQLSGLLRYLLYETNEKLVPLEKELDFLTSYVELEKLQLSKQLDFKFKIIGHRFLEGKIAPMILLTFVENCFKHYNKGAKNEKIIHIQISINDKEVKLQTKNSFKLNAQNEDNFDDKRKGMGLSIAKGRLRVIYKNNYKLSMKTEENLFHVSLKIPLI